MKAFLSTRTKLLVNMKTLLPTIISAAIILLTSSGLIAQCDPAPADITISTSGALGTALTVAFTPDDADITLDGDEYVVPVRVSDGNIVGDPVCVSESGGTFFFNNIVVLRTTDCFAEIFPGFRIIDGNPTCETDRENDHALITVDETGMGNYEGFAFIIYDPDNGGEFYTVTNDGDPFSGNDSGVLPGFSNELPTPPDASTPPSATISVPDPPTTSIGDAQLDVSGGGALPVTLTSFNASLVGKTVVLNWETTAETNNDYFEVERATPLTGSFEPIGQVAGAGFSTEANNYSLTDLNYVAGENFYRLKQVNFDGTSAISEVISISVSNDPEGGLSLLAFPNPASDRINLQVAGLTNDKTQVQLYSATGRLVRSLRFVSADAELEINDLPSGVYLLRLMDGESQTTTRIVKR